MVVRIDREHGDVHRRPTGTRSTLLFNVVVLVSAVVLGSCSSGAEIADAPASTVPTSLTPGTEADEVVDEAPEPTEEPAPSDEPIETESSEVVPILASADFGVGTIVFDDEGFVGLVRGRESESPQILRSADGREWSAVATSATSAGEPNTARLDWVDLWTFEDGLMVGGVDRLGTVAAKTTPFVSTTGTQWVEFDLPESSDPAFFLTSTFGDAFFGLGSRQPLVDDFVRQQTTLPVPDTGICRLTPRLSDGGEIERFEVLDCAGDSVGVLDPSTVVAELDPNEVMACAERIEDIQLNVGVELARLEPTGNLVSLEFLLPTNFVDLTDGGTAAIDLGSFGTASPGPCSEVVDPERRQPALVLADATSSEAERVSFPAESSAGSSGFDGLSVGEVTVGEGRHLVLHLNEGLWAFDRDDRVWSGPFGTLLPDRSGDERTSIVSDVTVSDSGSRAFAIAENQLVAFDFFETPEGGLEIVETILPIAQSGVSVPEPDSYRGIFATDDLYFIADLSQTWVFETPPMPSR